MEPIPRFQPEHTASENVSESEPLFVTDMSGFAIFLRIFAFINLVAALVIGYHASEQHGWYRTEINGAQYAMWAASGIISCVWWWALSCIVDACDKYRASKKRNNP